MKFAIIGLGSFGSYLARTLYDKGHEVMVIDKDKDKIEEAKDFSTQAVWMDSADKESLKALGVQDMDVVVVSLGPEMEPSILTVLYLHELGVSRIMAKALSSDHGKILEAIGATDVIYPERDMAIRLAQKLSSRNVLEYLPLAENISIQEIVPPESFIGKKLKDLNLTNRYHVQVIAIRQLVPEKLIFIPGADFVIKDSDVLVVMGEEDNIAELCACKK
ncbi:MAG: TrkA family potassium uptake protein [Candidatus Saccharicenans sp.]|jgi:trk system potassium uptake protein TrkA|nr:TrkA family potassium uptake protein [Candidatus Saccharicenans sp.]HOJ27226.1 TrkA family potassium uptake protein [Candidatus Saccharicenans sp.]HPC88619.1 TrkA family potassium uptake protein [Candidatus Saccharicenans sp.]HQE65059.1 TrkA family potassium uptake protein [Candidatus Saccharicenans sp.]HQH61372.1 TrkA family potassium uptake protein [Candidatus Saccharicenans sp.]